MVVAESYVREKPSVILYILHYWAYRYKKRENHTRDLEYNSVMFYGIWDRVILSL